jgi:glutamate formiminotransferase / 5-formyltetrahydrofolate cyclo-ligase
MALLECVINISEGSNTDRVEQIATGGGPCLLDVHSDSWHNRSVITLAGGPHHLTAAVRRVAELAVRLLDIRSHVGAHPRLGVLDVVPFVDLADGGTSAAVEARDAFARYAGDELGLPCFLYGAERPLPEVRKLAFAGLLPDTGPQTPHPTAGACCVGERPLLVAYNVWLDPAKGATVAGARALARSLRSADVRALGFDLGGTPQVSCNLIRPLDVGPAEVYDAVAAAAPIDHAELVGLAPAGVLEAVPKRRWPQLGLSPEATIEARLEAAGRAAID